MRLPDIKSVRFNLANILWAVLLVVLVCDFFALKRAYGILSQARTEDLDLPPTRSVRVNFESYDTALKRIDESYTYQLTGVEEQNPFLPIPARGE
jgi:hypothetical protein